MLKGCCIKGGCHFLLNLVRGAARAGKIPIHIFVSKNKTKKNTYIPIHVFYYRVPGNLYYTPCVYLTSL